MDDSRAAHELNARLTGTPLLRAEHRDRSDLARARWMRAAAGRRIDTFDEDDAIALHRLLAQREPRAFVCAKVARDDWQVAPHRLVRAGFGCPERIGTKTRDGAVEIDGAGAFSQMKRRRRGAQHAFESSGEQVLAMVLLHVIESALPVDDPFHF